MRSRKKFLHDGENWKQIGRYKRKLQSLHETWSLVGSLRYAHIN